MPDYQRDNDDLRQQDDADLSYTRQWGFPRYESERKRPFVQAQNNALMYLDQLPEYAGNALASLGSAYDYASANPITTDDMGNYLMRKYQENAAKREQWRQGEMRDEYQRTIGPQQPGMMDRTAEYLRGRQLMGAGQNSLASNY